MYMHRLMIGHSMSLLCIEPVRLDPSFRRQSLLNFRKRSVIISYIYIIVYTASVCRVPFKQMGLS